MLNQRKSNINESDYLHFQENITLPKDYKKQKYLKDSTVCYEKKKTKENKHNFGTKNLQKNSLKQIKIINGNKSK